MQHLEAGRIHSLTDSLRDSPLWLASECTVDLPDLQQGRWWTCECSYINPEIPSQHIFEGQAHEPRGSSEYSITLDTVAHALTLTSETQPHLELQVDLVTLGITKKGELPPMLMEYWVDQRSQGRPVPWIISHRLPRPQRAGCGATSHLSPTIPTGDSLWQVVTKVH
eukprot:3017521-Rhodomonas_salina.2